MVLIFNIIIPINDIIDEGWLIITRLNPGAAPHVPPTPLSRIGFVDS